MPKIPLLVEVIGEPGVGKTHFSLMFPEPILFDTTPKGEALVVVRKLFPDKWREVWNPVFNFKELQQKVDLAISSGRYKTIIIDTSANLQSMAVKYWTEKEGRKKPLSYEYPEVREPIDMLIQHITKESGLHLVMTSQMKDEYGPDGRKTGRRIRDGYKKLDFMSDLRFYIELKKKDEKYVRRVKVVKNRWRDKAGDDWISEIKPDWEGIVRLTGFKEEDLL